MSVRWFAVRGALAALSASTAASAIAAPPYFETRANIQGGEQQKDGTSWFQTWDEGMRFVLEAKYRDRSDDLWSLVAVSYDNRMAAKVRFDVSSARFDAELGRFILPICSVEIGAQHFESGRDCNKTGYRPHSTEALVATGLGESVSGSPRAAIAYLDQALAGKAIKPDLLKVALNARAESYESISYREQPIGEAADRARIAALADYRKLAELAPDIWYHQSRVGLMLQELGDYSSARAVFETIQKKWPDEDFNNTLRLAALERQVGNAETALNLLNGLVEREGPQNNMRYQYHRGWTLNALGRYDEAIAALTAGIKSQPDYAYAYGRRACAYASVSRLTDAAGDLDSMASYLSAAPQTEGDPAIEHDLERAKEFASSLRAAIASGNQAPRADICSGFWGQDDKPRQRSPLLPAQA